MKIQILTIFPEVCRAVIGESILKRAQEKCLVELDAVDLRMWTEDKHRSTDDAPYGGGPGMVMTVGPIDRALAALRRPESRVVFLSPQGRQLTHKVAEELSGLPHLILLCGHYEGVDQRVCDHLVDDEISIGDYVLTSGVLPALVVADAVTRLVPGVLGDAQSAVQDSFVAGLLDHPHYTRPESYRGWEVPPVLLSGNHAAIARWRREQAENATREKRPDLLRGRDGG